ncbi:MAG TPA: hypothetical protein VL381_02335, partial [Rhodocyclaceae bacterium]|nr:hypothetical protein [Rhodocyclaceae bacterium]
MADPIPTLRSLDNLVSDYSVFERDQVLTEAQLNSVAQYFDDQDRLTRVELIGVGIVGGLRAIISGGKVVIGKGVGVSTDGDLLLLQTDTTYDYIKPYDETAPFYSPFYINKGANMLKLWELVKEGESDVRKVPIATLPGKLSDYAVLMYVESYQQDHDLCNAADCDNLGVMATHTTRMLLVSLADAPLLLTALSTASSASMALTAVSAERPKLKAGITTTSILADLYRKANNNTHSQLVQALPALNTYLPGLLIEQFGSNPIPNWIKALETHAALFALKPPNTRDAGIQYYYDFLKDVVETWNSLLACLFENDSVLCPDVGAFPKHLLLGELSPAQGTVPSLRTGLYPSPLGDRKLRERARHLVERLDAMINSADFPQPSASTIRITPSRDERAPLEQRAIPFYYIQKPTSPIMLAWNPTLTARKLQGNNQAYQWKSYMGPTALQKDAYAVQIGAYDFFRIEGHFSQKIDNVMVVLKTEIEKQNLPITVRAILLHNDKKKIKVRPPRYTDLHRFH